MSNMVPCVALVATRLRGLSNAVATGLMVASCSGSVGDASGLPGPSSGPQTSGWLTRTDLAYGFEIAYPEDYVILREPALPLATLPPVLQRVRFQEQQIARGQFAELEPPKFSIEVFERGSEASLRDWLRSHIRLSADATLTTIRLGGAREGLRATLPQQLAPNEFVYLSTDRYVYRLTPLGEHGGAMIASFRLLNIP